MNILIVSQNFWPERTLLNFLAKKLQSRAHKITVLTGLPNYPKGRISEGYRRWLPKSTIWHGIKICRIPLIPRGKASNILLVLNYLSFMFNSSFWILWLCREKYNAIFVYQTSPITQALCAIILGKFRKIPVLLWVQDLWPGSLLATKKIKNKLVVKLIDWFAKFIYRNCTKVLVQSEAFVNEITKYIDRENIIFYPNTCEEFYQPLSVLPQLTSKYTIPPGFKIIFTGNIGTAQALASILQAAKNLSSYPQIKWLFFGEGSKRKYLQKKIVELQLENIVFWLGYLPPEKVPYILATADLCLAALNKDPVFSLTVPSKIQTYLACGKPIIAAIDGETARIINLAQCGIAVPAEDPIQLAKSVLKLHALSTKERIALGDAGRQFYLQNYESSKLVSKLENILDEV